MKTLETKQKRALFVIPIILMLLIGTGLAAAQGRGHGKGMRGGRGCGSDGGAGFGPGHRLEMMAKRLDLSEDQQASIKAIFEDGRKAGLEERKDLMRLRNELQGEMLKDSPSEKTVLSINEKIGELKTGMKALHLKSRLAVRQELTPEQRDQMLLMGGPGKHGGPGGPGKKGGRMGRHGAKGGCNTHGSGQGGRGAQCGNSDGQ